MYQPAKRSLRLCFLGTYCHGPSKLCDVEDVFTSAALSDLEFCRIFGGGEDTLSDLMKILCRTCSALNLCQSLLELFHLAPWKDELIESYSHGMKQKLIMAAALLHRPRLIVVDEPMVGLDPKSARMAKAIYREWVTQGGTVFMSTHTMEIAETMCDRIGIVNEGKLIACGTMAELRANAGADHTGRLESIFLKLTGGEQIREFLQILRSPF